MTAQFIHDMLEERGLKVTDCDAVCLSKGPGSYTGLRVGSSTAKGLCFGASLPLIALDTTEVLVWQALAEGLVPEGCSRVVPMIDARRMEVYSAVYSVPDVRQLTPVTPNVVDAASFAGELAAGQVLFIGDGAGKCADIIPGGIFVQTNPNAKSMLLPAMKAWKEHKFEDTAYFEPFYLKDFVATVSRKNLF